MTEIQFHHGAAQELREAVRYYERQVAGLGNAFIAEVERTTALILDQPQHRLCDVATLSPNAGEALPLHRRLRNTGRHALCHCRGPSTPTATLLASQGVRTGRALQVLKPERTIQSDNARRPLRQRSFSHRLRQQTAFGLTYDSTCGRVRAVGR